jgi:hypothetical protein
MSVKEETKEVQSKTTSKKEGTKKAIPDVPFILEEMKEEPNDSIGIVNDEFKVDITAQHPGIISKQLIPDNEDTILDLMHELQEKPSIENHNSVSNVDLKSTFGIPSPIDPKLTAYIKSTYEYQFTQLKPQYAQVKAILEGIIHTFQDSKLLPKNKKVYHLTTSMHNFFVGRSQPVEIMIRVNSQYNRIYILNLCKKEIENMPNKPVANLRREARKPCLTIKVDNSDLAIDLLVNDMERLYSGYYIRKYLDVDTQNITRFLYFVLLWGNTNKVINKRCNRLTTQALLVMSIIFMQKAYDLPIFTIDSDFNTVENEIILYNEEQFKEENQLKPKPKYSTKVNKVNYDLSFLTETIHATAPPYGQLCYEFFNFWINNYSVLLLFRAIENTKCRSRRRNGNYGTRIIMSCTLKNLSTKNAIWLFH